MRYPPFSELINIILSSQSEILLKKTAQALFLEVTSKLALFGDIPLMGPKPAPIEKIKDFFRWNILIKCSKQQLISVKAALATLSTYPPTVRIMIDFEPKTVL